MEDFFPELIEEVVQHQVRAKSAAMNVNQAEHQFEQHAGNAVKSRERIQAYMAQYEPHRLECELKEIQRNIAIHGFEWLDRHISLVAQRRGPSAALRLRDQILSNEFESLM